MLERPMHDTLGGHGAHHEELLWLAVAAAFVLAVLGVVMLYRRVTRDLELERAEEILARELDDLDR